jgi:hypothetical protein
LEESFAVKIYFTDDGDIRELVQDFESCSFHPSEFKHFQHLAVALWYVAHLPYDEACDRMKNGICRLAAAYGKTGYHETITVFWLKLVRNFLTNLKEPGSLANTANLLIAEYGDAKMISEYYSSEMLLSERAKREWVEPDLKTIGT